MNQITARASVTLTPEDAAMLFTTMDTTEQAKFFNHVAIIAASWENPFSFQMAGVDREPVLTEQGRDIMHTIGEVTKKKTI